MKTVDDLSEPELRSLVNLIHRQLWWDHGEKKWDRDKDWGVPCGLFVLLRIAMYMAWYGLKPEEGHLELS